MVKLTIKSLPYRILNFREEEICEFLLADIPCYPKMQCPKWTKLRNRKKMTGRPVGALLEVRYQVSTGCELWLLRKM